MSSDRGPDSYEPNYLTPDYPTTQEPAAGQPHPDGSRPVSGPDFASIYDTPEVAPGPSVYDEGYVAPTPAPVVDQGQNRPLPTRPEPQPQEQAGGYNNYGYPYAGAPGYQQVQPYPYPYAYQPMQPEHPSSGAIFGLGIASIFVWVTAPIAWYMGSKARKDIAKGAPYRFPGLATAGWVIGIVYSVMMIVFIALMSFLVIASTTVS